VNIVYYNSNFIKESSLHINMNNRAFNYGDGFFETIKIINSTAFNLSAHLQRIKSAKQILQLHLNEDMNMITDIIEELIKKNKIINGSVKLYFIRKEGGKYLPSYLDTDLLITTYKGSSFLQNMPISMCVFNNEKKTKSKLSNIKTLNSLIPILASIYAKKSGYENAIILNIDNNIVQAINANIFLFFNNIIYTPPVLDGCVEGTMRTWLLSNEDVVEQSLTLDDLKNAEEVFISNAISGFIPIKSIDINGKKDYKIEKVISIQNRIINLSLDLSVS